MEKNERLKAADKCASRYADENEARIARKAFMLGCEFEAQGEAIKGVILDTLPEQPVEGLEEELKRYINSDEYINTRESCLLLVARHFYELGCRHTAVMYDEIEYNRQRAEEAELSGDLEDEIEKWLKGNPAFEDEPCPARLFKYCTEATARHFYELGLNSKK